MIANRPRHYAAIIIELPTLEERREYLEKNVPAEWRDLTKTHLLNAWEKKRSAGNKTKNISNSTN